MMSMNTEEIRKFIRKVLEESNISNFVKPEPKQTKTYELEEGEPGTEISDPLTEVKMNQNADNLGYNTFKAPIMTNAGANGEKGQPKPVFKGKTEQA
jgi:hypothetical protein